MSFEYTERLLLTHPYFDHPPDSDSHAGGKYGERVSCWSNRARVSFFSFSKIMFLFLVHSVLVTLLRNSHIRIHCVTFYLPTNVSVNTQNVWSSLIPIVSIRLASLPTSQRRKVRMLFEKRGKWHVSSDSQCFYVRSSSSESFKDKLS